MHVLRDDWSTPDRESEYRLIFMRYHRYMLRIVLGVSRMDIEREGEKCRVIDWDTQLTTTRHTREISYHRITQGIGDPRCTIFEREISNKGDEPTLWERHGVDIFSINECSSRIRWEKRMSLQNGEDILAPIHWYIMNESYIDRKYGSEISYSDWPLREWTWYEIPIVKYPPFSEIWLQGWDFLLEDWCERTSDIEWFYESIVFIRCRIGDELSPYILELYITSITLREWSRETHLRAELPIGFTHGICRQREIARPHSRNLESKSKLRIVIPARKYRWIHIMYRECIECTRCDGMFDHSCIVRLKSMTRRWIWADQTAGREE